MEETDEKDEEAEKMVIIQSKRSQRRGLGGVCSDSEVGARLMACVS